MHHSGNIHTCQSFFESTAAEEQFLVVETKQMQNGGVKVMDADGVFNGFVTKVVGFTVRQSTFDSSSSHPRRKRLHVVVTSSVNVA